MVCPVSTITHVHCSIWPLLAHVLDIEFQGLFFCLEFCKTGSFAKVVYALQVANLIIAAVISSVLFPLCPLLFFTHDQFIVAINLCDLNLWYL